MAVHRNRASARTFASVLSVHAGTAVLLNEIQQLSQLVKDTYASGTCDLLIDVPPTGTCVFRF